MITYDPRTIAYITELVHFPMQHDSEGLRTVYNELGNRDSNWYMNFNVDPNQGSAQLVTARQIAPQQQQVSAVTLMPDRIQIQEEMTDLTLESFLERVGEVADVSMATLNIPQFNAQQCILRSLVTPRTTSDAREFLGGRMCGFGGEHLGIMERPVGMMGLRFMFPGSENDTSVYNIRIESYNLDVRSVFLEVAGVFPGNLHRDQLDTLNTNFNTAYDFMQNNICSFVAKFDAVNMDDTLESGPGES